MMEGYGTWSKFLGDAVVVAHSFWGCVCIGERLNMVEPFASRNASCCLEYDAKEGNGP